MSDDTTREAVERVRLALELRARHHAHPDYEQETTEGAFSWAEVRALLTDRDAATTAERDRIRHAVAGMVKPGVPAPVAILDDEGEIDGYACPLCNENNMPMDCICAEKVEVHNAALADVARIIDAEGK